MHDDIFLYVDSYKLPVTETTPHAVRTCERWIVSTQMPSQVVLNIMIRSACLHARLVTDKYLNTKQA